MFTAVLTAAPLVILTASVLSLLAWAKAGLR